MLTSESRYPMTYEILTNLDCNLNCTYCYEHNKQSKVIDIESCKTFLNWVYSYEYDVIKRPKNIRTTINLIGGESFLHTDLLDQIFSTCLELDSKYNIKDPFKILISTNGTLLTDPKNINFLKKYKDHFLLGFSIDGTKEIHDSARVDYNGNGSYDRAVAGLRIAQSILPEYSIMAKATFTHNTIRMYSDSVINLFKLGFKRVAANVVFTEIWTPEEAPFLTEQLVSVANYLLEHDLIYKVEYFQLMPKRLRASNLSEANYISCNYCGSCKHMRLLGMNNKIYGCHRMATANLPSIGILKDSNVIITNQDFIDEVSTQYTKLPNECKSCDISGYCPSCIVEAYEFGDVDKFLNQKTQCGWTIALVAARKYLKMVLENNTKFVDENGKEIQVL